MHRFDFNDKGIDSAPHRPRQRQRNDFFGIGRARQRSDMDIDMTFGIDFTGIDKDRDSDRDSDFCGIDLGSGVDSDKAPTSLTSAKTPALAKTAT